MYRTEIVTNVPRLLKGTEGKLNNMRPLMETIGGYMQTETVDVFKEGGKPNKWADLAPSTIAYKAKFGKTKTLIFDAILQNSIASQAYRMFVDVGSAEPYAAAHQFGFGARSSIKKRHMFGALPARPFLMVTDENEKPIRLMAVDFLRN